MTEQDLEIQILRREIAKLKKYIIKVEAERDAAIADLEELRCCHSCKHNQMRDGSGRKCDQYDAWRIWNHSCAEWEWRGGK